MSSLKFRGLKSLRGWEMKRGEALRVGDLPPKPGIECAAGVEQGRWRSKTLLTPWFVPVGATILIGLSPC